MCSRLAIGAEPSATSADIEAHVAECTACREFRREMRTLDRNIHRALELDLEPAPGVAAPVARPQRIWGPRWAMAASVTFAVITGFILWSALPRSTLAHDVVDHMKFEPQAWARTMPVERGAIERVLGCAGLEFDPVEGAQVVFVETCLVLNRTAADPQEEANRVMRALHITAAS